MIRPLVNLADAQVTRSADGILVDDPNSPYLIRVRGESAPTARIVEFTISLRNPTGSITAASLGRLPIQQLRHLVSGTNHPNEQIHRALVTPKQPGQRSWGADHWREVLDVVDWATQSKRPGGPAQAVADLWHVAKAPTAHRWIRQAKSAVRP